MTGDEKVEVSAGPVKVAASGRSVARVGEAIADLISPFSQGFGLVGDHIRIYRERSVASVLRRASEIAQERNEEIAPVNPKNLLPLIENASLESDEGNEITELWARLLLTGSAEFDAELAVFSDVLKRVGKAEASLLKGLVESDRRFPKIRHDDIEEYYNPRVFREKLEPVLLNAQTEQDFIAAIKENMNESYVTYGAVLSIAIVGEEQNFSYMSDVYLKNRTSVLVLEREGLLSTRNVFFTVGRRTVAANICLATNLGVALIARCYPRPS